ncbi:RsmD family RNA methyltransferase [Brumimicrobium aurantiacum]|uniref:Methyltransferase domain-containing protein n=1 Tax=Brumimicrobium aurantiacum TaxID=1737063 RepID=A0A3E1F0E4_9FLAO|nr:RsmD family RNA methyltransferase [Brumimicrobium aurantiacum]RFC55193.1 methyltransferase domain-containing protein [Brumimicrobium aurantiacum]
MRIISGLLKKQRFNPPKGFPSRPTTDFAKEGLFNILDNEISMFDMDILDLCAGTGNISFEFASREAGKITSVDKNFKCVKFMKDFSKKHGISESMNVLKADVFKFIKNSHQSYDLIFADPPFEDKLHVDLIKAVMEGDLLKEDGIFILEHSKHNKFEDQIGFEHSRRYGHVVFSFFKHPKIESNLKVVK